MAETKYVFLMGPRACGKSTAAISVRDLLPGWRVLDVDRLYEARHKLRQRSHLMVHASSYYTECRELVLSHIAQRSELVFALGGGTLINPLYPTGDFELITACKSHGPLVLILPSRFDFRNRRILFRRERERSYAMPRHALARWQDSAHAQYAERIDFFRAQADSTVYGQEPDRIARALVAKLHLQAKVTRQ